MIVHCDYCHDGTRATWHLTWEGTGHSSNACSLCFAAVLQSGLNPSKAEEIQ